jgi:hypothetical protein
MLMELIAADVGVYHVTMAVCVLALVPTGHAAILQQLES